VVRRRIRPDRIILGEIRDEEALNMLRAMNPGHDGLITTIHANNLRDAIARLETMAMMLRVTLLEKAIRAQITVAVHSIVQVSRKSDGPVAGISIMRALETTTL
jgi:pilus assembly protein CpaF